MNYGQLKLALIRKGLFIPEELRAAPEVAGGVHLGRPGEEVALTLAENFIVKAFLKSDPNGCIQVRLDQGNVVLHDGGQETEVGIIPLPVFLKDQLQKRSPLAENVCLDGYCFNIFLRAVGKQKKLSLSEADVLSAIESAFAEGVADLVQLNMDYCDETDRGFERLAPLVKSIKKKFKTFVALKGFPPRERETIDLMYAAGIDLLNFPLGGFAGGKKMGRIMPSHQVHTALEYAVGIFPAGAVWTELVPGTEPVDMTRKTIDHLAGRGIVPLLKLQPSGITTGEEFDRLLRLVRHLELATQREKLVLKWLYPNCRCVSPLDTRFFTQEAADAKLAVTPVYRSILGKKASEGFAALRRKLRIKNVSDSYESAGL